MTRHSRAIILVLAVGALGCQQTNPGGTAATGDRINWPWKKRETVPPAPPGYDPRALEPAGGADPFLRENRMGPTSSRSAGLNPVQPIQPSLPPDTQEVREPVALVSGTKPVPMSGLEPYLENVQALSETAGAAGDFRYIILFDSRSQTGNLRSVERAATAGLGASERGFHFVIGNGRGSQDGLIEVSDRWRKQEPAAPLPASAPDVFYRKGISICLVGDLVKDRPTDRQLAAARALARYLMQRHEIPSYRVMAVYEVSDRDAQGGPLEPWLLRTEELFVAGR